MVVFVFFKENTTATVSLIECNRGHCICLLKHLHYLSNYETEKFKLYNIIIKVKTHCKQ